jgi:hypothetical protein
MATAQEVYLSDVGAAIVRMRGRLEEIEAANDRGAMGELIELLVPNMVLRTELVGQKRIRQQKRVTLHLSLAFTPEREVVSIKS